MYSYYTKKYPEENEIVIVKLTTITDNGIYGKCEDYPYLEVFMPLTEITKRPVNIQKFFSPLKTYPVVAINIDKKANLLSVSYKKLNDNERQRYANRYDINSRLYALGKEIIQYATYHNFDINNDELFEEIVQKRLSDPTHEFKIDTFIELLENPLTLFGSNEKYKNLAESYSTNLSQRVIIIDPVVSLEFILVVTANGAIDRLKSILTKNIPEGRIACVTCIASPRYSITVEHKSVKSACIAIDEVLNIIETNCKEFEGNITTNKEYRIIKEKSYNLSNWHNPNNTH